MSIKIFYIDRFVRYSAKILNSIEQINQNDEFKMLFLGPDDKNSHWLSTQIIPNSQKVWTRGQYVRKLYRFTKLHKPDIVHISFELRTFGNLLSAIRFPVLLFLLKLTRTKVIITLHNILAFKSNNEWKTIEDIPIKIPSFFVRVFSKWFIKIICSLCDKIIVTTNAGKQGLEEFYGINKEKILVIREGFDDFVGPINNQKKQKFSDLFNGKKIILAFGVITPRKGLENAIMAFKKVHKMLPEHILVIAGSTNSEFKNYESGLHKLVTDLELEKQIIFTGFVDNDEVEILFSMAEIILYVYQPSVAGTGALSFAIQHGKAVIVTEIDTFTEILGKNDAFYVRPNDEKQICEAMLKIGNDRDLRNKLETSIKKILKTRSWHDNATEHLKLYKEIID